MAESPRKPTSEELDELTRKIHDTSGGRLSHRRSRVLAGMIAEARNARYADGAILFVELADREGVSENRAVDLWNACEELRASAPGAVGTEDDAVTPPSPERWLAKHLMRPAGLDPDDDEDAHLAAGAEGEEE